MSKREDLAVRRFWSSAPKRPAWMFLLLLALAALPLSAQTLARKGWAGSGLVIQPWWQQAVFYQVDPISFQDSNGDGFGDLAGIVHRLDYLESLRVDALVLSPFSLETKFAHGQGGPAFDPAYGAADDFDQLIAETSRRHMRVLVDLPLDQAGSAAEGGAAAHYWFTRGVAGLHIIPGQPNGDANGGPAERAARLAAVRSVVASTPGQRILLLDLGSAAPPAPGTAAVSGSRPHSAHTGKRTPQEAAAAPLAELSVLRQVSMPSMLSAEGLAAALNTVHWRNPGTVVSSTPATQPFPVFASDAADQRRSFDRYNDSEHQLAIAKALATLLLTTRADTLLYFGQEIGMETTVRDPGAPAVSAPEPPNPVAGEPTPMQWGASAAGSEGFSSFVPWIAMGKNAGTANVNAEENDPDSLLSWYRTLSALRHDQPSLREGSFLLLNLHTPGVMAWVRTGAQVGGQPARPVLVVLNLSPQPVVLPLNQALEPLRLLAQTGALRTLALEPTPESSQPGMASPISGGTITLAAYGAYAGEFTTQRGLESVATPVSRSARRGR